MDQADELKDERLKLSDQRSVDSLEDHGASIIERTDMPPHCETNESPGAHERLLDRLATLAQAVGTAPDLDTVFRALRQFVVTATDSNALFASLYDPAAQLRTCVYAWSENEEIDPATLPPMPMTDSPHSRAVATGEIIVTDDLQAALVGLPRFDITFDIDPRLPRASMAVPMLVMGRVIGGFEIQSPQLAAYRQEHIVAMRMAANLAAIAVENVRLLEGEREMRQQAEASERRFRALVQHASDLILIINDQHMISYTSPSVTHLLGYQPDDVVGSGAPDYLHPDDLEQALLELRRARPDGSTERPVDLRVRHRDGSWRFFEVVATDLSDEPSIRGIVLNAWDMTVRRREEANARFLASASASLATSLDYTTTLTTVANLAVPVFADWCFVDWVVHNGAIERLVVAHSDPAQEQLAHALQRSYLAAPGATHGVSKVARTGEAELVAYMSDETLVATARDAEDLDMLRALQMRSYICVPLLARRRSFGAMTFITGASGRHYTEADLHLAEELAHRSALAVDNARLFEGQSRARSEAEAARALAETAVREREALLSVASHELKNPLAGMLGFAQLLQSRMAAQEIFRERDRRAITTIVEQGDRLNRMLDMLLDAARIETGRVEIEQQPVQLTELVHHVVDEVQSTLLHSASDGDQQHTITLHSLGRPMFVVGDILRLEQVLHNLIGNAIKYSPMGGPISVRVEQQGEQGVIVVQDQGIGIPQDVLPRLFQRFYRAPNTATQHIQGLGIGLYVVREIVALHGGTVEVASAESEGSTFTIRLPLA